MVLNQSDVFSIGEAGLKMRDGLSSVSKKCVQCVFLDDLICKPKEKVPIISHKNLFPV